MARKFTVHTYNILSSHLSEASWYNNCKPKNCDPKTRFNRIMKKLQKSIDNNAIIGLQELPRGWSGKFHVFFEERGYSMMDSLYGYAKNGYMGIAVAYPRGYFSLQNCEIFRVADKIRTPPATITPTEPQQNWIGSWFSWMNPFKKVQIELPRPTVDVWDICANRHNTAIFCRFRMKQSNDIFCVATYHMPCVYQHPDVMVIHVSELMKQCKAHAGDDSLIVMGDYNILPDSSPYNLITKGNLDKSDSAYPPVNGNWKPDLDGPMKSAYVEVNGKEPSFTNHAGTSDTFTGTLDYIFYSGSLNPVATVGIPELKGFPLMPNDTEPSDHILIGADFEFQ